MDSDAWRPFDLVDVKRQVEPGAARQQRAGFVEPSPDEAGDDDDDFASATAIGPGSITLGWM
jgi:hypothetical protein